MKKLFSFFLVLLITISVTGIKTSKNGTITSRVTAKEKEEFVSGQFIIGYNDDVNMDDTGKKVKEKFNLTQLEKGYKGNFEVVEFPSDEEMEELIEEVKKEKGVKYVEPNYLGYADTLPNDPQFDPYQWNFLDRGTLNNGYVSNFGVQATSAWTLSTGSGVKIAILDTGVAYESYKIYQKVKGKQVLVKEFKKAPDLANTIFDTANAKNFSVTTPTTHANDDMGHGTHVCGTIAAITNDNVGCAGIAYNATILPIKVLGLGSTESSTTIAQVANGIRWAADKSAKVINMSLGFDTNSTTLSSAIDYAYGKGVVIVCSAGNKAAGTNATHYPAAYEKCIAVGATRFDGTKTYYSNYGSYVDIVAPGGDNSVDQNGDGYGDGILQNTFYPYNASGVYTFNQTFNYYLFAGTSMSAPHVTAIAGLILSKHPTYTVEQVRTAIQSTAIDLGDPGRDDLYGYGLIDAYAAVNWTP